MLFKTWNLSIFNADGINFSCLLFHRRRNTETEEGHASFSHKAGFMGRVASLNGR